MAVVSNAGPLIALARIERLDLLVAVYGEVDVPPAVHAEVTGSGRPGVGVLDQAEWLRVRQVYDQTSAQRLRYWLDAGESEAIVLAQERSSTLLMDERRGRGIATALGIPVTGTVGTLIAAKRMRLIPNVTTLLDALITNGVHISARLYRDALRLSEEA